MKFSVKPKASVTRREARRGARRGSVMIEFSLVFVFVLLPLTLALMQYGIILQTVLAMSNLSREAGRYASVNSLSAADDTDIKTYIKTNALGLGVFLNNSDISVSPAPNANGLAATRVRYSPITISITYNMGPKTFLNAPFTSVYKIPIFSSNYTTSVVMIMQ